MRFIPVTCEQREAMLDVVGAKSVDELFDVIPASVRMGRPLALPEGLSEIDLAARLRALAARDSTGLVSFLGAGCYDHHIPAIVDHVVSKPEFFTAYTPYQPEVSQGTLQAIYEFQTMICELTGMDVSNASMYDGATAMAEAATLARHVTGRPRAVVSSAVHPEWRAVLATYAAAGVVDLVEVPAAEGRTDVEAMRAQCADAACVIVPQPGFYGCIEDLSALAEAARSAGALFVVCANPIMLGVIEPPGAFGADVVVGEGQPLGSPMSFGGPGFGFFACREEHLRRMPGRIAGRTVDAEGRPGFVLTMQTREQHIRRGNATSNICSNHALNALAASVYLAAVGREGFAGIAHACVSKAHYLHDRLVETGAFGAAFDSPFGYEFALRYEGDVPAMQAAMLERGFLAGVDLGRFAAEDAGLVLFAVTEKRTRAEMDAFAEAVSSL